MRKKTNGWWTSAICSANIADKTQIQSTATEPWTMDVPKYKNMLIHISNLKSMWVPGKYRLIAANNYLDNNAKRPARKDMDTAICSNRRGFGWSWAETCARRQIKLQPSPAMWKNVNINKYFATILKTTLTKKHTSHVLTWSSHHILHSGKAKVGLPETMQFQKCRFSSADPAAIKALRLDRI